MWGQVRERAEVDMLSLHHRFNGMVDNSLEPMQTQIQPPIPQPAAWLWDSPGSGQQQRSETRKAHFLDWALSEDHHGP